MCDTVHFNTNPSLLFTDEMPILHVKNDALIIVLSTGVVMVVIIVAVLTYRRRKGNLSLNFYVYSTSKSPSRFRMCSLQQTQQYCIIHA